MASALVFAFAFMWMALAGVSLVAVYDVGGSNGWTNKGNVDYKSWSRNNTFYVGDTIVFHLAAEQKVLKVSHAHFRACETRYPKQVVTSANGSITLKRAGHQYYIAEVYGDCMAGQKVDISVTGSRSTPAPPPSHHGEPSPAPAPVSASAPSPSQHHHEPSPAPTPASVATPPPSQQHHDPSPAPTRPSVSPPPQDHHGHEPTQAFPAPAPAPSASSGVSLSAQFAALILCFAVAVLSYAA